MGGSVWDIAGSDPGVWVRTVTLWVPIYPCWSGGVRYDVAPRANEALMIVGGFSRMGGPWAGVLIAPRRNNRGRWRGGQVGVPDLIGPGRERGGVTPDVELGRLVFPTGQRDAIGRIRAAADGKYQQRLPVEFIGPDLDLGCGGDNGPGELSQPVSRSDQVDALQAADGGLVFLDTEHDAAAVPVRKGGDGLEHGAF
jgi:hypothetical protein